jgi:hypothetical protein
MPWKACCAMDERLRCVARLLEGEAMTDVCREFGISRKTGYKILSRYRDEDSGALTDRSRRPVRYANQLPPQIEGLIVSLKRGEPHWGPTRSARCWSADCPAICASQPSAPSTPCSTATTWSAAWAAAAIVPRERAPDRGSPQRPLVRRLQGRVPPRQQPLLLPAHRHRSRLALPAALRGPRCGTRRRCHRGLPAPVSGARPASTHL